MSKLLFNEKNQSNGVLLNISVSGVTGHWFRSHLQTEWSLEVDTCGTRGYWPGNSSRHILGIYMQ